jgi:type II secretory pathway pseudopilin PulG
MNKTKQKGYALLFTVVLVSIISLLVFGLSSTSLKQLVLSLGAKDSQFAFFQSDMATECALYASLNYPDLNSIPSNFSCGRNKDGNKSNLKITQITNGIKIEPEEISNDPCFRISITEDKSENPATTKIEGKGYNICNTSNNTRAVERTIEVNF